MRDLEADAAEGARLRAVRAELIEADREQAALDALRLVLFAEAGEIAQARMARSTSGNSRGAEMELRSIALELAVPLRVSDRVIQRRIGDADQLTRLFPLTVVALAEGRISRAHASALLDFGCVIADADARAQYEQEVLAHAETTTAARTRAYAERQAELRNPRPLQERMAEACAFDDVRVVELGSGRGQIQIDTTLVYAHAIHDRVTTMAKAFERHDRAARRAHAEAQRADATGSDTGTPAGDDSEPRFDERTRGRTRVDIITDLILTGSPAVDPIPGGLGAIRAQVQITVPVTTLSGVTTGGAELDGRAPVDAETARRLAGGSPVWERVMTDPVTATVLAVDTYKPPVSQRRFVGALDVHCRCPGCRRPARYTQIDHNDEWHDGGATHLRNLASLCVDHHTIKTETAWTVTQLGGGTLEWTSPLGYRYRDEPPTRVVFLPDEGDAPF